MPVSRLPGQNADERFQDSCFLLRLLSTEPADLFIRRHRLIVRSRLPCRFPGPEPQAVGQEQRFSHRGEAPAIGRTGTAAASKMHPSGGQREGRSVHSCLFHHGTGSVTFAKAGVIVSRHPPRADGWRLAHPCVRRNEQVRQWLAISRPTGMASRERTGEHFRVRGDEGYETRHRPGVPAGGQRSRTSPAVDCIVPDVARMR